MNDFCTQRPPAEFLAGFAEFSPLAAEPVPVARSRGRVIAEPLTSPEALPPFTRSLMDGYAIRAADAFGCCQSAPALLTVIGEIATGTSGQALALEPGQTVRIWTGGELPREANAVVMIERTRLVDRDTVAILEPVDPADNIVRAGEDYMPDTVLFETGHRLRAQDLALLASLGITTVPVFRRPRVAILSTGDELVTPDQFPPPGKIRNVNSISLAALVEEAGGQPLPLGICPDDFGRLLALCTEAISEADMLLLSGGSSLGRRDFTRQVFAAMPGSAILVPGVPALPGKPAILARQGNKALFGLPGHAASALVGFVCFVRPLLRLYIGLGATLGLPAVKAITSQAIFSTIGREEYIRVRLTPQADGALPLATPISGKSGLLGPLVQAHGLLPISRDAEGLSEGKEAMVLLLP